MQPLRQTENRLKAFLPTSGGASRAKRCGKPHRVRAAALRHRTRATGHRVYANDNPVRFIDPDGRNAVTFVGGVLVESWNLAHGEGFNGAQVWGALKDGYNGEGDGFASAAFEDATTFIPAAAVGGAAIKLFRVARVIKAEKLAAKLPTMGVEGSKGIREVIGSEKEAKKMFNTLRGVNKAREVKPGVFTAKGATSGTVTFRATSKSGPATVDTSKMVDGVRKVKFKEH